VNKNVSSDLADSPVASKPARTPNYLMLSFIAAIVALGASMVISSFVHPLEEHIFAPGPFNTTLADELNIQTI
jgi:hypothetical protein